MHENLIELIREQDALVRKNIGPLTRPPDELQEEASQTLDKLSSANKKFAELTFELAMARLQTGEVVEANALLQIHKIIYESVNHRKSKLNKSIAILAERIRDLEFSKSVARQT